MVRQLACALVCLTFSGTAEVHAASQEPPGAASSATPTPPQQRIGAQLGVGAPLGLIGLAWTLVPAQHLRLEMGAGFGASDLQLSLMPIIALGSGADRFTFGAGVSYSSDCCLWLHADLAGYEHVSDGGFFVHVAGGVTVPTGRWSLGGKSGAVRPFDILPQVRVGLGSSFDAAPAQAVSVGPTRSWNRLSLQAGYLGDINYAVAWAVAPFDWWQVEANLGGGQARYGLSTSFALGHGRTRFVPGMGAVKGTQVGCPTALDAGSGCDSDPTDIDVVWLRADLVGIEHVFSNGLSLILKGGFVRPFPDVRETPGEEPNWWRASDVHARFGVGWWI